MEHKIGSVVTIAGKKYKVETQPFGFTCRGCDLIGIDCHGLGAGACSNGTRDDGQNVIFKEVKENKLKRDNKGRFCKSQKGTEKKYIKLGKPYIEERKIKVVIEEQSHRGDEFGNEKCTIGTCYEGKTEGYKASNGLWLASRNCPERSRINPVVFMRGDDTGADKIPLVFDSLESYLKFEDAVKEYNEHFSKPQVKEVTMEELHKLLGYEVKIKKGD